MNAPTLYHGTRRGFTPGGVLVPRSGHKGSATTAPLSPGATSADDAAGWVYATGHVALAWAYAWAAPGRGRPKVLTLQPHGRLEPDPEHSPAMDAWRCDWASVVAVDTDPAITEAEARDGWRR